VLRRPDAAARRSYPKSIKGSDSSGAAFMGAMQIYARTGTDAVRSSFPQLTQAPLTPRKIAFQMQ
jgi:hypothetical protein